MNPEEQKQLRDKHELSQSEKPTLIRVRPTTTVRDPGQMLSEYTQRIMHFNGLTHVQVAANARRLGHDLRSPVVHQITRGEITDPKLTTIRALAAGLGRPVEELLEVIGMLGVDTDRDPELEAIQVNYPQLPQAKQQQARFMINALSREIQRLLEE